MEDDISVDEKIRKVKNVGFSCRQKAYIGSHIYYDPINIGLTFVYILHSLSIVCMYKKHTRTFSVS